MRFRFLILTILLLLTLSATSLFAQSHPAFKINIPFDFTVSDKTLPAGEYTFSLAANDFELIRGVGGQAAVFAPAAVRGQIGTNYLLVFHQLGEQHFLAEVWPAGSSMGRSIGGQSLEKDLRKSLVARNVTVISGATKLAMKK